LVRILVEQIVGQAPRMKDIKDVEEELAAFELKRLRTLQMELLELTYEDAWGHHLRYLGFDDVHDERAELTLDRQVRDDLDHEALQFLKEQRIRCLLRGAWFPTEGLDGGAGSSAWRFVRLSHNRRYLHYAGFDEKTVTEPRLDALQDKSKCYVARQEEKTTLVVGVTVVADECP